MDKQMVMLMGMTLCFFLKSKSLKQKQNIFKQLFLHAADDEEETIIEKLLQKIMVCVQAAFPYGDQNAIPPQPRNDIDDVISNSAFFSENFHQKDERLFFSENMIFGRFRKNNFTFFDQKFPVPAHVGTQKIFIKKMKDYFF